VLPLLEGLDETFPHSQWIEATPRECAGLMQAEEVDVSIVSTWEGLRQGWRLLPGAAIGSDGAVRSVALYSKVPLREIRSVLLDRASLSSVNLATILWRDLLGIDPESSLSKRPLAVTFDIARDP